MIETTCYLPKKVNRPLSVILALVSGGSALAQGCSDAGICSVNGLHSGSHHFSRNIALSESVGWASVRGSSVFIFTTQLETSLKVTPWLAASAKLPYQLAIGDLGHTSGVGSATLSASVTLRDTPAGRFILLGGFIIPTNKSDLSTMGRSLPMEYQTSQGVREVLMGFSYNFFRWSVSGGFQHPLGRNENGFLHERWIGNENASNYFESAGLKRGNDLTVRVERKFLLKNAVLYISMLPIYRLQKDEIIKNDNRVQLSGSDQLTINVNVTWEASLTERLKIRLTEGNPVLWRPTRADGLTRVFVLSGALVYSF